MDQSASVFALRDSALLVSFKPSLTATPVHFPGSGPPLVFVVAQSLVAADKHVTAPICYNLRVVECTLAALLLAKILGLKSGLPPDAGPLGISLRGLHDTYYEQKQDSHHQDKLEAKEFESQLERMLQLVLDYLPQEDGYTRDQISELVGVPVKQLEEKYMQKFPVKADRFMLRQRAAHVFSEALRVQRAVKLFGEHDDVAAGDELHKALGELLQETQKSCREDYDCSCPELDELCDIAARAGSYGGRLTGAGWGGCSVHLVPEDKVEAVRGAWEKEYYKKKWPEMSKEELEDAVVVSRPGGGSCVYEVKGKDGV